MHMMVPRASCPGDSIFCDALPGKNTSVYGVGTLTVSFARPGNSIAGRDAPSSTHAGSLTVKGSTVCSIVFSASEVEIRLNGFSKNKLGFSRLGMQCSKLVGFKESKRGSLTLLTLHTVRMGKPEVLMGKQPTTSADEKLLAGSLAIVA